MRLILRCVFLLFLLSLCSGLLLETSSGQEKIITFITQKFEKRFHARVHIGHIHCFLPFYIQLNDLSIETTKENQLLSSSEVTLIPVPIPLSSGSLIIPYVKVKSFRLHLQTVAKMSSVKNDVGFFISIPFLHLVNGEAHDPSLPTPYTFSFDGGTRIENDNLYVEGELLDQTSLLPLYKARGQLQVSHGTPKGWIQCSFKKESIMNRFKSLFVQFNEQDWSGSWKLENDPSYSESHYGTIQTSLEGMFNVTPNRKKWCIDCTNMDLVARLDGQKMFPWFPETLSYRPYKGSFRIEGSMEKDLVQLTLQRCSLSSPAIRMQCSGIIHYTVRDTEVQLYSHIDGTLGSSKADSTFTLKGDGVLTDTTRDLFVLFSSPFIRAEGSWKTTPHQETGHGTIDIQNFPLAFGSPLIQSLSCTSTYNSLDQTPHHFHFHVQKPTSDSFQAKAIDINAHFESLIPLEGKADARIEKAKYQETSLTLGKALFEWNSTKQYAAMYLKGTKRDIPWNVKGACTIQKKGPLLDFECSEFEGTVGAIPFTLNSPIQSTYTLSKGLKDLNLDLSVGSRGTLLLTHNTSFRKNLTLTLDKCPLFPLFLFLGKQNLHGEMNGKTVYTYGGKFPELHSQNTFLYKAPIELPQRSFHTLEGHCIATTHNNTLTIGLQLEDKQNENTLSFHEAISILPSQSFPYFMIDREAPLEGKAQGTMDIALLFAPFHDASIPFQGDLTINNQLSGTLSAPIFSGEASLKQGYFTIPKIEGLLKNISAEGKFFGPELIINTLRGTDDAKGSFYGNALLTVEKSTPRWHVNTFFSNMALVNLPSMNMEGTGSLSLERKQDELLIHGQAQLINGIIDLSKTSSGYTAISTKNMPKTSKVLFDIHLEANKTLTIRGRSFTTTWSGIASLTGSSAQPMVMLNSSCDNGSLLLAGRKMTVEKGSLEVHGSFQKDSKLEVTAVAPLPQCTARLLLKGPLSRLKVFLRSSPARSENEILSLLLFDKELPAISPLESLQLANAALSLEKKNVGATLFDTVKNEFGIDKINLGSSGPNSDDLAFTVGKYISKGVAVTLSKDISSEANRVGLEVDMTDEIKANAMVGDDESAILSLTWKKEF